jgi:uncharacterized protein (TIGR03083 family)
MCQCWHMGGSVSEAAAAVDRSCARFTTLLRSGLDGDQRIKASTWTIRDLGSHLTSGILAYRQVAAGKPSPYADINERAETNELRLEATSHLSLEAMADIIDAECAVVVADLRAQPGDALIAWHGGITLTPRAVLGAMVGEFLFHGLDLARTVGARWRIDRVDALPAVDVFIEVAPHLLVRDVVRDVTATVEVRCRGYDTSTFEFRDGALTVTRGAASKPDVHMSVDPVSFLLVGYKRGGLAKPIATGRALAWGRRPWLALRFPGFFQAP